MRLLFDINHPVQAHLFRQVVTECARRGHEHRLVARDKDVTLELLRHFGLDYRTLAPLGHGRMGALRELITRELRFWWLARTYRPTLIVGTSVHAARVARLTGARSVIVNDDDAAAVPLFARLAYPLAHRIVTPACLAHERHGSAHVTYAANQQLFYLHPARFQPDPSVRQELGLAASERYGVVRLSALDAHHDRGVRGVTLALLDAVAEALPAGVRVFVSSEKTLPSSWADRALRLPSHRLHDALAHAEFYLGDSQSVCAEAAVLGTPALRLNDFVGRISYLAELEQRELAYGFEPGQEHLLLERLRGLLAEPGTRAVFAARRQRLLEQSIDPLPWFVDLLEREAGQRHA